MKTCVQDIGAGMPQAGCKINPIALCIPVPRHLRPSVAPCECQFRFTWRDSDARVVPACAYGLASRTWNEA